jgi:hypothetical protein
VITEAQALEYLETLGIGVPDFVLAAAVAAVAAREQQMIDAGYTAERQVLVQSMAVALVATTGPMRRLASQSAPSGASRSFKYTDGDLAALRRSLAALDAAGTVADLVGVDPVNSTLLMVVC